MAGIAQPDDAPAGAHPPAGTDEVQDALRSAFRDEWGRVVATLIRLTGDWSLAEDCAQDAFAAAANRWLRDGVPLRPGAWLTTTARNSALDRFRRSSTEARKLKEVAAMQELEQLGGGEPGQQSHEIADDRLRLIFTCCHPALPLDARVALTLRTLCGLTVAEIAHAFGASEAAMTKRLVRARQKISHAGIPYRVPTGAMLPERRGGVLAVLYLLFTEGYAASAGAELLRAPLSSEAIRLTRMLAALMPDDAEVLGLLGLELLHDGRRPGRVDALGRLVSLEEQDRSTWDAAQIAEGIDVLATALRLRAAAGPYLLQAQVAACHSTAPTAADTDWREIALLYDALMEITPSPYVRLSRIIAISMAEGPETGLVLLADLRESGALGANHYLPASEADLLRRAGRFAEAAAAYRSALELVTNEAERGYLERRLAEVS